MQCQTGHYKGFLLQSSLPLSWGTPAFTSCWASVSKPKGPPVGTWDPWAGALESSWLMGLQASRRHLGAVQTLCIYNRNPGLRTFLILTVFTWFHLPETLPGDPSSCRLGQDPPGNSEFLRMWAPERCGQVIWFKPRPLLSVTGSVTSGKLFNLCLHFLGL